MKTTIGIITYNGATRLKLLLSSIYNYTSKEEMEDVDIVVIDDGTPDEKEAERIHNIGNDYGIIFRHPQNLGISASWNHASRFIPNDLIILLNDDIQICHSSWLKCLKYFFENNTKLGHVSFPTLNLNPNTALPRSEQELPNVDIDPWLSWTPGGQAFAFFRKTFEEVGGFNSRLTSFYEETDFGYKTAYKGYFSYILPFPVVQHWGSQTFSLNKELAFTTPNSDLPMEKYRELLQGRFSEEKVEPLPGKVYRMEYSRALFAQEWNCSDIWDAPQNEVEERLRDRIERRKIKWLDKNLIPQEKLL